MPKYTYYCQDCKEEYDEVHSINERMEDCKLCGHKKTLERIPSMTIKLNKNKTGKVVEKFIEDSKEDIEEMKKDYEEQR